MFCLVESCEVANIALRLLFGRIRAKVFSCYFTIQKHQSMCILFCYYLKHFILVQNTHIHFKDIVTLVSWNVESYIRALHIDSSLFPYQPEAAPAARRTADVIGRAEPKRRVVKPAVCVIASSTSLVASGDFLGNISFMYTRPEAHQTCLYV